MRKNKITKLSPWGVAFIGILPFQRVFAQYMSSQETLYGSVSFQDMIVNLLMLAAIILIPIAFIIGIIIFIIKKVKKRNAQKNPEIGKP